MGLGGGDGYRKLPLTRPSGTLSLKGRGKKGRQAAR